MSEAQQATPEQESQAQQFIEQAKQQAMQEIQQNMQIEIQMRTVALAEAVKAKKEGIGASAITESAEAFLKFLKTGEAVQKEQ